MTKQRNGFTLRSILKKMKTARTSAAKNASFPSTNREVIKKHIKESLVDVYFNENPKREMDMFDLMAEAALRVIERPARDMPNQIIPCTCDNSGYNTFHRDGCALA